MPDTRAPLSIRQIASVFDQLAREHARKREQADAAAAWRRIEFREGARAHRAAFAGSWLGWRAFAAAAAVAAVVLVLVLRAPATLEYELHGAVAKDGLIQTQAKPALIAFSDQSRIEVAERSTVSVDVVGKRSALARLRQGRLSVSVRHEDDTDWRFFAGPYEVRVVGTQFDLGWEPSGERLSIAMREGRVHVIGPDLDRMLSAGQRLDLGQAPPKVAALEKPAAEPEPVREPEPPHAAEVAAPRPAAPARSESLSALLAKGKFNAVVQSAESAGLDQTLATASGEDLRALAQAAHYTGRIPLAVRAFQTLRQRFGQQPSGRQAAFFLGRIYDQQGKAADALRWLNIYLSEAPGDVYASEALGRKLTLVRRTEGDAAAARVARQYLERFPNGAYARTARALLAE